MEKKETQNVDSDIYCYFSYWNFAESQAVVDILRSRSRNSGCEKFSRDSNSVNGLGK